jgi:hypothetical protein
MGLLLVVLYQESGLRIQDSEVSTPQNGVAAGQMSAIVAPQLTVAPHPETATILCEPQRCEEAKGETPGFVPFVSFVAKTPGCNRG